MKKNYFLAIAVAVLMLASEVAWAADISFSGQFRPRFNYNETTSDDDNARQVFDTRVRLNANANVNANTGVFLQLQSEGMWGVSGDNRQSTGDADSASDDVQDVGLHQAFVTLKNFMGQNITAKIGRQEVVLDGHRLFGHTGWTQGAQSSDAIRLDHSAGNHALTYLYIRGRDQGAENTATDGNYNVHAIRANVQGVMGGDLSGYFIAVDDEMTGGTELDDENLWYTIGARQKGKLGGLDYRVEYYHQFGDGSVEAGASGFSGAYTTTPTDSGGQHDRDAHMFGVRVGKTFKNASMSPTITLWYDSLTGSDDDDLTGNDWGGFNTLYDTGHKFYGFMDHHLNARNLGTANMGLQDMAVKTKWKLSSVNTLKLDVHHFETQTDLEGGDSDTLRATDLLDGGSGVLSNSLGEEIDVVFIHKYDSNTKILVGYSHYFSTRTFGFLNGGGCTTAGGSCQEDEDWMFVMVDTKF